MVKSPTQLSVTFPLAVRSSRIVITPALSHEPVAGSVGNWQLEIVHAAQVPPLVLVQVIVGAVEFG